MKQEALKLALDALETELSIDWTNNDEFNKSAEKMHEAIKVIKEALAQEQEPVAWQWLEEAHFRKKIPKHSDISDWNPLYRTPQRTWVGLTDDEMENTFIQCGGKWNGDYWKIEDANFHPFVRTIEAKLKEKNNA